MSGLTLKNINKTFPGDQQAIRDFNLEVKDREFLILVGPTACGKSTLLRMIGGLEEITSGSLMIDGMDMTDADPKERNVAMLFKNSVLYPGMSVEDNLAFSLRMAKMPAAEIAKRVDETVGILKIDGILEKFAKYLDRYNSTCRLYIIGEGELKEKLQRMAQTLGIAPNVIFTGKMTHDELLPILSKSKALLVNTVKDNNMISIVEAIAVGTPIVTTDVPLNSTYIKDYQLGIAKKQWDESDLNDVVSNSEMYIENCMKYRYKLSTKQRVEQFLEIERGRLDDGKK